VVWTVHDEIIVEVPEAEAPAALETLTKIMSTPPPWISTLPLAAEGAIVDCYTK
jgi:DNA polymerase I-like protein with 3'-5' exonuclease and polymerase domains